MTYLSKKSIILNLFLLGGTISLLPCDVTYTVNNPLNAGLPPLPQSTNNETTNDTPPSTPPSSSKPPKRTTQKEPVVTNNQTPVSRPPVNSNEKEQLWGNEKEVAKKKTPPQNAVNITEVKTPANTSQPQNSTVGKEDTGSKGLAPDKNNPTNTPFNEQPKIEAIWTRYKDAVSNSDERYGFAAQQGLEAVVAKGLAHFGRTGYLKHLEQSGFKDTPLYTFVERLIQVNENIGNAVIGAPLYALYTPKIIAKNNLGVSLIRKINPKILNESGVKKAIAFVGASTANLVVDNVLGDVYVNATKDTRFNNGIEGAVGQHVFIQGVKIAGANNQAGVGCWVTTEMATRYFPHLFAKDSPYRTAEEIIRQNLVAAARMEAAGHSLIKNAVNIYKGKNCTSPTLVETAANIAAATVIGTGISYIPTDKAYNVYSTATKKAENTYGKAKQWISKKMGDGTIAVNIKAVGQTTENVSKTTAKSVYDITRPIAKPAAIWAFLHYVAHPLYAKYVPQKQ